MNINRIISEYRYFNNRYKPWFGDTVFLRERSLRCLIKIEEQKYLTEIITLPKKYGC